MRSLWLTILLLGCQGVIEDPRLQPDDPGNEPSAAGALPSLDACADDPAAGPTPIRRLTRAEYRRSIEILFGDVDGIDGIVSTFGNDERIGGATVSYSFDTNRSAVDDHAVDRYHWAAEQIARVVASRFDSMEGSELVASVGRRIYRRPLSGEEQTRYRGLYDATQATAGHEGALRLVLTAMLQSPEFLYHYETGPDGSGTGRLSPWSLASRLSFFLWRAAPDDALLDAAARGDLDDDAGVAREVQRLLDSPRAGDVIADFHAQWLAVDELHTVDPLGLDDERRESMRDEVVSAIAALDDAGALTADALVTVAFWTQPAVMTRHYSPVLRGKMVRDILLCDPISPPPPGTDIDLPVDPSLSPRERLDIHKEHSCAAGCHNRLDPIGFGFDHYDELGEYREAYDGFPVDATGEIVETRDANGTFDGAEELVGLLADSEQVRECIAEHWVRFALGRALLQSDKCLVAEAADRFRRSGYDVRELLTAIATNERFLSVGRIR